MMTTHWDAESTPALAVWCEYQNTAENADKFWTVLWIDRHVIVHYGRNGGVGEVGAYHFQTKEEAAKKVWSSLREKIGKKGYRIVGANPRLMVSPSIVTRITSNFNAKSLSVRDFMCGLHYTRDLRIPKIAGESARFTGRTARTGYALLLELIEEQPNPDAMLEMVCSNENFLRFLAVKHTACPEEGKVAAALMAGVPISL